VSTVADILAQVSQDIRLQLSADDNTPDQAILIDYVNRIHKQMLRFSRWDFLLSEPQYFMTSEGQTDYWLGPTANLPASTVDTGLNFSDVDRLKKDSIIDISNTRPLKFLTAQPFSPSLNFRTGQTRPGLPAVIWQDHNDANIVHLFPGPDNNNLVQPVPATPILTSVTSGALAQRSYFVRITFLDTLNGESTGSPITAKRVVAANKLIKVISPTLPFNTTSSGVVYNRYNVYAGTAEGSETLQTVTPINIGTNWTEPGTGLTTSGAAVPTVNTLEQVGGYIIQFRYYKDRLVLNDVEDVLQIPDDYQDIVVYGVDALAWKLIGRGEDAQASNALYRAGLTEMIWDKNLFPDTDFVRPDPASHVNSQTLGFPDSSFF
jgi:hypothetical protein